MVVPTKPPANGFVRVMRKVYNPLGFSKGYNFPLFIIFAGATWGFVFARLPYLSIDGIFCRNPSLSTALGAAPGECWEYDIFRGHERIGIILHLAGILPGMFLACFQFVPVIRHKLLILHRIDGYIIIACLLLGNASALMIARHAFGGTLATQAGVGLLVIATTLGLSMAYYNIKRLQIEQHRAWMLRTFFYAASIITLRLIMFTTATIASYNTSYYFAMPCYKIAYMYEQVVGSKAGPQATQGLYPVCAAYFSGSKPDQNAVVNANYKSPKGPEQAGAMLDMSFGMALWMAFWLHAVGVEIYLQLTPAEHNRLRQVSYEKQLEAGFKNPGFAGTTVQQFGDALPWYPETKEQRPENGMMLSNGTRHEEEEEAE